MLIIRVQSSCQKQQVAGTALILKGYLSLPGSLETTDTLLADMIRHVKHLQ